MTYAQLISPSQLAARLSLADLLIIDCRFALEDPAYGARCYAESHLPGARFLDLERNLSGPVTAGRTGRHPLPDATALAARLAEMGLTQHSQVVLYDDGNGAFAARAWWLLLWLGKRDGVALLDGGLAAWKQAGGLLTSELPTPVAGDFTASVDAGLLADADEVHRQILDEEGVLLDARARPRYAGEVEPIDPVAGHIPGAVCAPFTDNLDQEGRFRSPTALRQHFEDLMGDRAAHPVVVYCGSGVTACHNLFAMSLAGFDLPRLYAGSWSEWITDPERPVSTGEQP